MEKVFLIMIILFIGCYQQPSGGNIPAMKLLGPEFDTLYNEVEELGYYLGLDVYRRPEMIDVWTAHVRVGVDENNVYQEVSVTDTTARAAVDRLKIYLLNGTMNINLSREEKEELLRAAKSHFWRLKSEIENQSNEKAKEEFRQRKETIENVITKLKQWKIVE